MWTLLMIKQHPKADVCKGKQVVSLVGTVDKREERKQRINGEESRWQKPKQGRLKLNLDGSFMPNIGEAGAGMILRVQQGDIIFAACRVLLHCASALESEMAACDEGLKLALNWSTAPIDIEMDCATAVNTLTVGKDQSALVHLTRSIKEGCTERNVTLPQHFPAKKIWHELQRPIHIPKESKVPFLRYGSMHVRHSQVFHNTKLSS
uniref:Uncharacterized protein n=1 Tax=Avena sativa TaxID=4498 RepID=A0ACD5ZL90_AVESA